MIFIPNKNIYFPQPKWGYPKFQRGSVSVTVFANAAQQGAGGLVLSPSTNNVNNIRFGNTCFSGVRYLTTGAETQSTSTGSFSVSRGDWLDSGDAADVWVQRTINSGNLDWMDSGSGRLQITTDRTFGIQRTSVGTDTTNLTVDFWDAASGGNLLDSVTFDLIAEFSV